MAGKRVELKDLLSFEGSEQIVERDIAKLADKEKASEEKRAYLEKKGDLFAKAREEKEEGEGKMSILELTPESPLELAIFKATEEKRELEVVARERKRRVEMSQYMAKRNRENKIKSKPHRKRVREEKAKEQALRTKIEEICREEMDGRAEGLEEREQAGEKTREEKEEARDVEKIGKEILNSILGVAKEAPPAGVMEFNNGEKEACRKREEQIKSLLGIEAESDFEKEKREAEQRDMPEVVEEVMPGWNCWGGEGIEPEKNASNVKIRKKAGIDLSNRRDFRTSHVIYNEKAIVANKNAKYGVSALPYGYTSEREFRKFISVPVRREENSLRIFKELVGEEICKKPTPGVMIKPIRYRSPLDE